MTPTLSSAKRPGIGTIYRETLRRHWNIWATYGVLMLLLGPVMMTAKVVLDPQIIALSPRMLELPTEIMLHIAVLGVGCCLPLLLFSYLDNRRAADLYHALPVKRGQLYWGKALAGLTILLTPYLLLGGACGVFIFAVGGLPDLLCRIGQIAAIAAALYGTMVFIMANCGTLFESIVYFSITEIFCLLFVGLMAVTLSQFTFGWNESPDSGMLGVIVGFAPLWQLYKLLFGRGIALRETLQMLLCCAAMLGAGALLHNRRKSESAGQSFAFRPLFYVEAIGASLTVGMGFYYIFFQEPAGLLLGVLAGALCYFILDAIRSRGFKNIRETLGVCVGMAAAVGLFFGTAALSGTFGYERYLPPASGVKAVSVCWDVNSEDYLSQAYTLTEEEDIEQVLVFHRLIIENKALVKEYNNLLTETEDPLSRKQAIASLPLPEEPFPTAAGYSPYSLGSCRVTLDYMMKDGRLATRYYTEIPLALTAPLYKIAAGSGCSRAMAGRIEMDMKQAGRTARDMDWTIAVARLNNGSEVQKGTDYDGFVEIMSAMAEDLKARPAGWGIRPEEAPLFKLSARADSSYSYGNTRFNIQGEFVYAIDRQVLTALEKYGLDYSGIANNFDSAANGFGEKFPTIQYVSASDYNACMALPSARGSLFQFGGWWPYAFWEEMEEAGFVKQYAVTSAQCEQLVSLTFNHYISDEPVDVLSIGGSIYLIPRQNRSAVLAVLKDAKDAAQQADDAR